VGCKNQLLSENYAKQLYTRRYLRDTSVTGRLGDIQVNEDGSKTMNDKDQKITQLHFLIAQCNCFLLDFHLAVKITNQDGFLKCRRFSSKTMNDKDQKIIHRWDYGFGKPTWTTQSSKNISQVLDHP
jgi:hypothetical protein